MTTLYYLGIVVCWLFNACISIVFIAYPHPKSVLLGISWLTITSFVLIGALIADTLDLRRHDK